ncbi:MAG: cytochrome c-type biogenesis protein [Myxococcota bacterium]
MISLALALALASGQYAPQRLAGDMLAPEQEARVQKLAKHLRCAVCQGLSVADSPSSMARAQLEKVRELIAEGRTDQEVIDYFVARYGEWVLLQPTAQGVNATVWVAPAVMLVFGLFVILSQVKKRGAKTTDKPLAAPHEDDEYLARVRAELER